MKSLTSIALKLLGIVFFYWFLTIFIGLQFGNNAIAGSDEVTNQIDYKKILKDHFLNYELRDIKELTPFARDYLRTEYPNLTPSIVSIDFDGNGFPDYAFLLQNSKDGVNMFVIFLQLKDKQFKMGYCKYIGDYSGDLFIIPLEPGSILDAFDSSRKIKIKHPAVELHYFERHSDAFYWNDEIKRIISVVTSD